MLDREKFILLLECGLFASTVLFICLFFMQQYVYCSSDVSMQWIIAF
jgi:hypothetical protein